MAASELTTANEKWNELYSRVGQTGLPQAEIDSVPQGGDWGAQWESERTDFDWWLPRVAPGMHVLDLGCGNGSQLASLVRHRGVIGIGIDLADVAIELGRARAAAGGLDTQMKLRHQSFHQLLPAGPFELVYSLYALQFARASQLALLAERIGGVLRPGGVFCAKVRSTNRSVPASYCPVPGEPNTYVSSEPHEEGMVYHHYSGADLQLIAQALNGDIVHLDEVKEKRSYDPYPDRAWWQVVIKV